ncbi:MAG: DNA adenine methylase [bacterium]|nr:DNA adenine methylase [bacterium]
MIRQAPYKKNASLPLKWHGGKHYLAKSHIIPRFPEHTHYVEPFFGGGAVLFQKPLNFVEGHSEVINDIYDELMNFWNVLRSESDFPKFCQLANLTPFGQPVWRDSLKAEASEDCVTRALNFFIRYRQSRQGLGRDFATMTRSRTRRGMNEQVSSWLSAIDGLEEAHARLQRVVVLCEPAITVIQREDSESTFFYCDPPYLHETRTVKKAYFAEMSREDHENLLSTLGGLCGKFILSGYKNELYESAEREFGWNRVDIPIDNKASGAKSKRRMIESLWTNFEPLSDCS